jgi:gliding motility-associated-like protein
MRFVQKSILILLLILSSGLFSQDISLYQQFNGQYDYLSFGNTLNEIENGLGSTCTILSESSADLQLQPNQQLIAAYLYWAGSGAGDYEVTLNETAFTADRTFIYQLNSNNIYFAAFTDITDFIMDNGNGSYTLKDLIPDTSPQYCPPPDGNSTYFGGWAVTVIYEDLSLPMNQVNVFDGMESVSLANNEITITLNNLFVLDNIGAKIGFLAWEGDANLANNETLLINGNLISNPPLNPEDNAFNGTNSFTNSSELFNMDIDFYNIEDNINPGDTSATITLTSNQDLVMVNNIITVLNTELPDATIVMDSISGGVECGNRDIGIEFTVHNNNSTAILPANTPIAFYANTTLIGQSETSTDIPIDGSESGSISVTIPQNIPSNFLLKVFVDDDGSGNGIVNETNEDNNEYIVEFTMLVYPDINELEDLELCDVVGVELFDLTLVTEILDPEYIITYHEAEEDAENNENPINNPETYENISNPQTIYIRVDNGDCHVVDNFQIKIIQCPLPDATISIDNELYACRQRDFLIEYTPYNNNGNGPLQSGTPIAFYAENQLVGQDQTLVIIPVGASTQRTIEITLPESLPDIFILRAVIDDIGNGIGIVDEINEFNNDYEVIVEFGSIPPIVTLPDLVECDRGFNSTNFDLTVQNELITNNDDDLIFYYTSSENAIWNIDPILDPGAFINTSDPQEIFVRLENDICFAISSFFIITENCEPFIPQGFSPNGDGMNDEFEITGLLNVFPDFELLIYSREGNLIYKGYQKDGFWDGFTNEGLLFDGNLVPTGLYYYVLHLNDPQYPKAFISYVYINY